MLSCETDRRWVRSADNLLDLLLESLARFQMDLQGELTAAEQLWLPERSSTQAITGQFVHGENYFSNIIRWHLTQDIQQRGLVLLREVEIRPSVGSGTGQRVDIRVETFWANRRAA